MFTNFVTAAAEKHGPAWDELSPAPNADATHADATAAADGRSGSSTAATASTTAGSSSAATGTAAATAEARGQADQQGTRLGRTVEGEVGADDQGGSAQSVDQRRQGYGREPGEDGHVDDHINHSKLVATTLLCKVRVMNCISSHLGQV